MSALRQGPREEPDGQSQKSGPKKVGSAGCPLVAAFWHYPYRECDRGHPNGHVDPKHPTPAELHETPSDDGSERRPEGGEGRPGPDRSASDIGGDRGQEK